MKLKKQSEFDLERRSFIITFPNDLSEDRVLAMLRVLSSTIHSGIERIIGVRTIVFETWATSTGIKHRVLLPWQIAEQVTGHMRNQIPGLIIEEDKARPRPLWKHAVEIGMARSSHQLKVGDATDMSTGILTAAAQALTDGETAMLQWIITPTPGGSGEFNIVGALLGREEKPADIVDRRKKLEEPNFLVSGRVAATAPTASRAQFLVRGVVDVLKSSNGGTAYLKVLGGASSTVGQRINQATTPWLFPCQFNVPELAALAGFPIGAPFIPGLPRAPGRHLYATEEVSRAGRLLGTSNYPGHNRPIAQDYKSAASHSFVSGTTGCLHPDTPIYDPISDTTMTVKERYEGGRPFFVFSMRGQQLVVARAEPPVQFRKVGMYRLYNDDYSVVVTGQHRVWNGSSYVEVGDLYSQQQGAAVRLPTISESVLSTLQQDVQRSMRTSVGSRAGCHPSARLYDQRPHQEGDTAQVSSRQRDDAGELCFDGLDMDGSAQNRVHTHLCHESAPLAKSSSSDQVNPALGFERRALLSTEQSDGSQPQASRSLDAYCDPLDRVEQPRPSSSHSTSMVAVDESVEHRFSGSACESKQASDRSNCGFASRRNLDELTLESLELAGQIESPISLPLDNVFTYNTFKVEREQDETYYDFHVPIYENYLACGLIHHNSGKSTLMANWVAQDMANGYGVIVIDASNSDSPETLFRRSLGYIPDDRIGDVIVIDVNKSLDRPVGFNVLDQGHAHMVVDQISGLIQQLYPDSKGVWTRELIHHGLYALIDHGNSTIMDLMALIRPSSDTEKVWARDVARTVRDPRIRQFWEDWLALKEEEKRTKSQPLYDRLWQFNNRPEIHNILGQTESAFQMQDILEKNKILLINLAGLPDETAALLGTLLFESLWTSAQSLTPDKANFVYLDEVQQMTKASVGLDDIMARGRKHKFGLTLSTQYLDGSKVSAETKAAIINNAGTKVIFSISANEAKIWGNEFGRHITADDFTNIRKFDAYAKIANDDGAGQPVSLTASPPFTPNGDVPRAIELSALKYGKPIEQVELDIASRRSPTAAADSERPTLGSWKL